MQGLQINSFFLHLVGDATKMARFSCCGWGVCAGRDEGFLQIPETEIQAALPSASKLDEGEQESKRRNNTWSLRSSLTVFFNKTCLGYEKYQ